MINKHKSNKIKENSNTVRHLNNGTDHRHSKSCCDQSSPARRTIKPASFIFFFSINYVSVKFIQTMCTCTLRCGMISFREHNICSVEGYSLFGLECLCNWMSAISAWVCLAPSGYVTRRNEGILQGSFGKSSHRQMTFSDAFSLKRIFLFWFIFLWQVFLSV